MTEERKKELIRRIENDCPFNRTNGYRVAELTEGHAVMEVEIEEKHRNFFGLPHGGILFSLADVASGMATSTLHEGRIVTAGSSVNFLYASPAAKKVRAEATVIKKGSTLVVVQAEVTDDAGKHLLTGQYTMHIS